MTNSTSPEIWDNRTVTVDHTFAAPRDLVWEAWTNEAHLAQWWGPEMFTNPRCEADFRPGGAIHIDMLGPDGVVYPMKGTVREVTAPERLVFISGALDGDGVPMFEVLYTATFTADGDVTHLALEAQVISTTEVAGQYLAGMEAGWSQSLAKLDRFLAAPSDAPTV